LLDPDWYVIDVPARTTVKISFTRAVMLTLRGRYTRVSTFQLGERCP